MDNKTLKKVQETQLEVLLEFDKFCKKEGLEYQLFAGSLLGAVRHQGFIPWDDDIDIIMKRDDYEKLLERYNANDDYFLQTYESDPLYYRQFARLRKNNTIYKQNRYAHLDVHHGVFIDIFPLDYVYPDYKDEKLRLKFINVLKNFNLYRSYLHHWDSYSGNRSSKMKMISLSNYLIGKKRYDNLKTKLIKKRPNDTGYLNHLTDGGTPNFFRRFLLLEKEFDEKVLFDFEGHKFPGPKDYDTVLKRVYGDYMELPPVEFRHSHHGIVEIKVDDIYVIQDYIQKDRFEG